MRIKKFKVFFYNTFKQTFRNKREFESKNRRFFAREKIVPFFQKSIYNFRLQYFVVFKNSCFDPLNEMRYFNIDS